MPSSLPAADTVFGRAAILAARRCQRDRRLVPDDAWIESITQCTESDGTRRKSCPHRAFVDLCAAGYVIGLAADRTRPRGKNGDYAVAAVDVLRAAYAGNFSPGELWREIPGGPQDDNGQMHVVLALWQEGLIVGSRNK